MNGEYENSEEMAEESLTAEAAELRQQLLKLETTRNGHNQLTGVSKAKLVYSLGCYRAKYIKHRMSELPWR